MMKTTSAYINKRAFTLLEVMIVIGLLSIVGSFFTLRIASYLQERTYEFEQEMIASRLTLAEHIATLCDTSVTTHIDGNTLTVSAGGRAPYAFKAVLQKPIKLRSKEHKPEDKVFSPYGSESDLSPQYPDEVKTTLHPN